MTTQNTSATGPIRWNAVGKRMLTGAAIGLTLISLFLIGAESKPEWPKYWMVRPLIVVPVAGSMGGLFSYFMDHVTGFRGGWRKALVNVVSLLAFLIALWLGTVLGLDGTLWD